MPKLQFQDITKFLARLSKRERTIFYFTALTVLLFLMVNFVVYPVYSKISSQHKEIKEKESRIRTNLRIVSQKEKIASEGKRFQSFLRKPKTDEEGMIALLKTVENTANKCSLYVIDMKPAGVKEDKDKTKRYMVTLTGEGQMDQIVDFLYNVESSEELLVVDKYQISPKSRESSVAECSITISKVVIP
ncbi:MAG: hypothetical protein PHR11_05655 [Candidatus Omnitrophica bacterium]|nr:hypothetical protein [Candidatus Omnitrophota bacterium]